MERAFGRGKPAAFLFKSGANECLFLIFFKDIILDGLYLNCTRLVKEYFDKNLKIELKQNKINDIGLKSMLQLLADKDLRGAEILLNHMVH